jgi:serine/threonine-protein kinase RIM15
MADPPQSTGNNYAARVLPSPAVAALKREQTTSNASNASKIAMLRTLSEDIREEREDLKEAAEYNQSVVVDLALDGTVRFISPSWLDVVGTSPDTVVGKPIADLLVSDKDVFVNATEVIRKDDARSHNVRFTVLMGPASSLRRKHTRPKEGASESEGADYVPEDHPLDLEGQGIMVYDRSTGQESHVSQHQF